mmetsp:Transcript_15795/g.28101  ORF Transcript_15795/g.28101 Transcript_15795/m.28101 type:complete len:1122 (+) Transcript_15795:177-3542(+)|eukprot:CAMPEP_0184522214 /NCGR_PEP_ID=MMETSP0198_2-20121128/8161_1 /TAXON_ID=1112570 /ORGANISM="Thraustochytrium sp., Strain LLF1b" /LENGTH=1121 /DNA_ID=CAMNT_0026913023 /DNA_START=165 /DNA_END=3530 /DNA_ORIENTATION=+
MADVEELRAANADLLKQIDDAAEKIKELKLGGAEKSVIKDAASTLVGLKFQLPRELMSEKDAKEYDKMLAKKAREAEKAARSAKWAPKDENKKKKKVPAKANAVKFVNTTPVGEKKDMTTPIAAAYDPPAVEAAWDAWWEKQSYYTTDAAGAAEASDDEKFVIVIPPPNVTGSLHIGHALTCSIEDALCRWNRMMGKYVMWLPGTDHAGIATQAVVERKLMRERGLTKHDLGREKFLDEIWAWKNEKGAHILNQLRRLGASVDHSRAVFTMDERLSKCVTEAFVRMFEDGLIYRDTRLVNWSHALNTALSDIEVDHKEISEPIKMPVKGHNPEKTYEFGYLTSFAYQIVDDAGQPTQDEIVVATTRLETMLGDSGVAIHPEDPRYKHLHGKSVYHPFRKCSIPIVLDDELVDMNFGTAAVKITPAHDPNDFKCGRKHNLEEISVLNDDGTINGVCGAPFEGIMRYDARYLIEEELEKLGLFRGKKAHAMSIPICSRSGDVIEPRLVPQWWVSTESMAAQAVKKVKEGELKLLPEAHEKTWYRWLENTQDWCVSRQLWWGHRIPAYKVTAGAPADVTEDKWFVGRNEDEARAKAAQALGVEASSLTLAQDPDVLDTWFSSGLFPFSTFGWNQDDEASKQELKAFFPGTLLETGHDIIFFWVARMVMMSLHLMKELPFKTVYFHAMVRDKYGRKMSKSLGNVLDPIQVMEGVTLSQLHETLQNGNLPEAEMAKAKEGQKMDYPEGIPECGADALRFGLLAYTQQGRDVNLDINRVAANRRFCNKLWQVTKFMMMNIGETFAPSPTFLQDVVGKTVPELAFRDRWILSKLGALAAACNQAMSSYEFEKVTSSLTKFYLDELCDVYVEAVKPIVRDGSEAAKNAARNTLWYCLDVSLRLMHPVMPFVTEELWQRLPGRPQPAPESIMIAHYPGAAPVARHAKDEKAAIETAAINALGDAEADSYFDLVNIVAGGMRSVAANFGVSSRKDLNFFIKVNDDAAKQDLLTLASSDLAVLGKAASVELLSAGATPPLGCASGLPDPVVQVFLQLEGIVDPAKEIERLTGKLTKVETSIASNEKRRNSDLWDKMNQVGKDKLLADLTKYTAERDAMKEQIQLFTAYMESK